jgi:hypothetical protein
VTVTRNVTVVHPVVANRRKLVRRICFVLETYVASIGGDVQYIATKWGSGAIYCWNCGCHFRPVDRLIYANGLAISPYRVTEAGEVRTLEQVSIK